MKRLEWTTALAIALFAGPGWADNHAVEFADEVKKGDQRPGFTNKVMVKAPTFTVGAVAVKDQIKAHKHNDGSHVLYIVSGSGTMMVGDKTTALKPGVVVYVPVGIVHSVKATSPDLTFVDFAQPPFDPNKMEWVN